MDNYFTFNGQRSSDFQLIVERYPTQSKPRRKLEEVSLPGRNGSLLVDGGGYENITVTYQCYFRGGPDAASRVASWLYGAGPGYARLEDTYHPGVFRLAVFTGPVDMENIRCRFGRFTLSFLCLPELFLTDGEKPIHFYPNPDVRTFTAQFRNPTPYPAKPLIRLTGEGACTLNLGTAMFTVSSFDGYIDIDCDTGDCFKGSEPCNSAVSVSSLGFPVLEPGLNRIVAAGVQVQTIEQITIWPRWWVL